MSDKVCDCQFCIDYKRLYEVLPVIPEEHREWLESICDRLWHIDDDLNYKRAVLDGSWPDAVEILEHALAKAKARKAQEKEAEAAKQSKPEYNYEEEVEEDPFHMGDHQGNFF